MRPLQHPERVAVLGWAKTGTKSLGKALEILHYPTIAQSKTLFHEFLRGDYRGLSRLSAKARAYRDLPWNLAYELLDSWYPRCRFILTVRDEAHWIHSYRNMARYQERQQGPRKRETTYRMRSELYGRWPEPNDYVLIERYQRHNREVARYFQNRPDDLLVLDLETGDGWKELCRFLQKPVPNQPFPHINKGLDPHHYTLPKNLRPEQIPNQTALAKQWRTWRKTRYIMNKMPKKELEALEDRELVARTYELYLEKLRRVQAKILLAHEQAFNQIYTSNEPPDLAAFNALNMEHVACVTILEDVRGQLEELRQDPS